LILGNTVQIAKQKKIGKFLGQVRDKQFKKYCDLNLEKSGQILILKKKNVVEKSIRRLL
jgi:hypothetical protein